MALDRIGAYFKGVWIVSGLQRRLIWVDRQSSVFNFWPQIQQQPYRGFSNLWIEFASWLFHFFAYRTGYFSL
jgi:hypothetical protein